MPGGGLEAGQELGHGRDVGQERGALEDLLGRLRDARASLTAAHGKRPLFLKVAPDLDDAAVRDIAELAVKYDLDALIVSNTTLQRPPHLTSEYREEQGGLSGQALFHISTQSLRLFAGVVDEVVVGHGRVQAAGWGDACYPGGDCPPVCKGQIARGKCPRLSFMRP